MNEHGKSCIEGLIMGLSLILIAAILLPYIESCGFYFPFSAELFQSVEFSERAFWFMICGWLFAACHGFSYLVGNIFIYAVYFVQRAWYLRKLRKPERVYTGDPL